MTKYNEELLQAANIADNLREFAEERDFSYSGLRGALTRWRKRNNLSTKRNKKRNSLSTKRNNAAKWSQPINWDLVAGGSNEEIASGATVKYSDPNQPTMDDDDEEEEFEDEEEEFKDDEDEVEVEEYEDEDEDDEEDDSGVTWDQMKPTDRRTLVHSYFEVPDFQRTDGSVILQEVADELEISVNSVRGYYYQYQRKLQQEGRLNHPTPTPAPAPPVPDPPPPIQYPDNGNGQPIPVPAGITPEMWYQDKQQQREWEQKKYYDSERRKDDRATDKRRQDADNRTRDEVKAMNDRMFAMIENRGGGGDGGILGSETLKGALEDRLIDVVLTGGNGQEKSDAVQICEMLDKSGIGKEIVGAIRDYRRDDPRFDPYDEEEEEDEDEEIEVPPETYRKGLVEFLEPALKDDKKAKRALRQQIDVTVENVLEEFGETESAEKLTSIMGSRMNLVRKVRDIGLQLKKVVEGNKTVEGLAEEFWDHSPEFAKQLGLLEYQQIVDLVEQYKHTGGVARDYDFLIRDDIRAIGEDAIEKLRTFKPNKDL